MLLDACQMATGIYRAMLSEKGMLNPTGALKQGLEHFHAEDSQPISFRYWQRLLECQFGEEVTYGRWKSLAQKLCNSADVMKRLRDSGHPSLDTSIATMVEVQFSSLLSLLTSVDVERNGPSFVSLLSFVDELLHAQDCRPPSHHSPHEAPSTKRKLWP